MNERFFLFGFLLWSIKTADAAVAAQNQPHKPQYGICIDVTLCQQPIYQSVCSVVPICPSPTIHPNTQPSTTFRTPSPTKIPTASPTRPATNTIVPSKATTVVKSTEIFKAGKQVNVLNIQNNFKITFGGKKSNITKAGN